MEDFKKEELDSMDVCGHLLCMMCRKHVVALAKVNTSIFVHYVVRETCQYSMAFDKSTVYQRRRCCIFDLLALSRRAQSRARAGDRVYPEPLV